MQGPTTVDSKWYVHYYSDPSCTTAYQQFFQEHLQAYQGQQLCYLQFHSAAGDPTEN